MLSLDIGLGLGAFLMVVGVTLQCRLSAQRMSAEEAMKDGRWTEKQANRAIRIHAYGGPTLILLGAATLVASWLGNAN